jgi:hypothetical protein
VGGTTLPTESARAIRNNAGGAWNHAQYWKVGLLGCATVDGVLGGVCVTQAGHAIGMSVSILWFEFVSRMLGPFVL